METERCHRKHQCSQCSATFVLKSRLKDHLKIHSDERPFMCEVCGASFKFASVLQSHLTIHTRTKRYSCDVCGKLYRYRASLYIHMRTHTGERPYKCDACPASFLVRSHLTDHLRIHSGDKPFHCEICPASFSRTIGLQKHLRGHINRGAEMDMDAAMYRAKRIAKDKSRCSGQDHSESSSHPTDKESKNEENVMLYAEPLQGEVDVVLTLCSIGDGSICSYNIENQDDSKLTAQAIMTDRTLTAKKESGLGGDHRLTHGCRYLDKDYIHDKKFKYSVPLKPRPDYSYSHSAFTQGEDSKHSVLPNLKASRKHDSAKHRREGHFLKNKTHKEVHMTQEVNIDNIPSSQVSSFNQNLVQVPASGNSGRPRYILHTAEANNTARGEKSKLLSSKSKDAPRGLGTPHLQDLSLVCHKEAMTETKGTGSIPFLLTLCVNPVNGMLECEVQTNTYQDSACGSHRNSVRGQTHHPLGVSLEVREKQNLCESEELYDTVIEIQETDLSQKIFHHKSTENASEASYRDMKNLHEPWLKKDKASTEKTKPSQTRAQEFSCQYCPRTFRYKSAVGSHERSHTGEKPFQCPECGKSFSKKSNMETHTRTHTGERPFLCDLCGKHFSHKYTLEDHRWLHTEETPFLCGICGKGFKHKTSQQVHLKRHAGVKKFKCDFCPKAFVTKVDFQDHRRVHTKERPYKCEDCGQRFKVRHHLRDHCRLHGQGNRPNKQSTAR